MNRIKELRINQKRTLQDVADALGISNGAIANYENGLRDPNSETWHKLAQYFNVTIGYLMGYEE